MVLTILPSMRLTKFRVANRSTCNCFVPQRRPHSPLERLKDRGRWLKIGLAAFLMLSWGPDKSAATTTTDWTNSGGGDGYDWTDGGNWTGGVPSFSTDVIIDVQPIGNSGVGAPPNLIFVNNGGAPVMADNLTFGSDLTAGIDVTNQGGEVLEVAGAITNDSSFVQTFSIPVDVTGTGTITYTGGAGAMSGLSFNDLHVNLANITTTGSVAVQGLLLFTINSDSAGGFGTIGPITTSSTTTISVGGNYTGAAGNFFQLSTGSLTGATISTLPESLPNLSAGLVWVTSLIQKGILFVEPTTGNIINSGVILPIDNETEFNTGGITFNGGELLTSNNILDTGLAANTPFSTNRLIGINAVTSAPGGIMAATTGTTATYNGVISNATGVGLLQIGDSTNAGTVVLTAANSYTGGTDIVNGILQVNTDSNLGTGNLQLGGGELLTTADFSSAKTIALGAGTDTLAAHDSTTATYTGIVSGNGALTVGTAGDHGTVFLTANNSYSGGTNIASGTTLQIGVGGSTGSLGTGNVADLGSLVIDLSGSSTVGGAISGAGTLTQEGTGTTVLTGSNSYAGGTTITAGTLQVGSGGATGSIGTGAIADGDALVIDRSGTLMLNNVISGTGALTQEGSGTTILGGTNHYSGGTVITGGVLQVASLTANVGTGTFTLGGGELLTTGNTSTAKSVLLKAGVNTLAASSATAATYNGVIRGTGGLTLGDVSHTGTVVLAGNNTYSGATSIVAGTLQLDGSLVAASTVSVGSAGTLSGSGTVNGNATLTGNGVVNFTNPGNIAGTLSVTGGNWNGAGAVAGQVTATSGVFTIGSGADLTVGGGLNVTDSGSIVSGDSSSTVTGSLDYSSIGNSSFGGVIAGVGNTVTLNSASAQLSLLGVNTYTGATTVTAGTLLIGGSTSAASTVTVSTAGTLAGDGTIGGNVNLNGGILNFTAATIDGNLHITGGSWQNNGTVNGQITVSSGNFMLANNSTLTSPTGMLVSGGTISSGNTNSILATSLDYTSASSSTFAGVISGATNTVTVNNSATDLTLSGANTYTGATTVSAGTLMINGSLSASSSVEVDSGATLAGSGMVNGNVTVLGGTLNVALIGGIVTATGGATVDAATVTGDVDSTSGAFLIAGGGNLTANSGLNITGGTLAAGNASSTIVGDVNYASGSNSIFAGIIAGTGSTLTLDNTSAKLTLTGANTYTGGTTITAGTLQIGNGGANGALGSGDVVDDGALAIDRSGSLTVSNAISGTGTLTQAGTGTTVLTGSNSYAGGTVITAGTLQIGSGGAAGSVGTGAIANGGALVIDRSGFLAVGGAISGGGSLTQEGTGTTVLSGSNTYLGTTTITGGVLQVASLSTNLGTDTLTLGGGELLATGASTFAHSVVLGAGTDTLAATTTATFSGVIGGTGALTVGDGANAGTVTLSGINTYAGATTVRDGTLNLTGSLAGPTTVASGAILTGTGSMSGRLTIAGGGTIDLSGANSTLSLRSGGLTLGGAGAYNAANYATLDFSGGANGIEQLNAAGHGLTANNVYLDITGSLADGTYTLASFGSAAIDNFSLSRTLADVSTLTVNGTQIYTINDGTTSGTLVLTVTGVSSTAPDVAYWNGAVSTVWNGTSSGVTNFSTNLAGTSNAGIAPGTNTDVILNSSLQTGTVTTTLGADTTINSLNVNGNGTTTIGAGHTLTINALGDSNTSSGPGETVPNYTGNPAGQGILIGATANAFTIDAALALGSSQTWTNGSASTFTLNGNVSGTAANGTQVLTLNNTSIGGTTISGLISDSVMGGAIAVNVDNTGAGVTQLANTANSYTGGTTLTAGTLQLTENSMAATGELGSTSGQLSINGGTLDLNGTSQSVGNLTGTGGTILNNGNGASTLTIGTGNATGGTYAGVLADNTTGTGTLALVKTGSGIATLSGGNTFSGGTTVSGGTLAVSADANLGTGILTLGGGELLTTVSGFSTTKGVTLDTGTNTLAAATDNTATYNGIVGGAGGLTVGDATHHGTVVLTDNNAYSGGTTILSGNTLDVGNGGASGTTGAGAVTDNGSLVYDVTSVTVGAVISGTGSLAQNGGLTILTGSNTYSGGTTISTGTLQLGNDGATGAIAAGVTDNATLAIDRGNAVTLTGVISGLGSLTQLGTGTTVLTGSNTYSGVTTIAAGTLQLGSGGTTGAIAGSVTDNANLAIDHSNAVTFARTISGTGGLTQMGTGTTVLTGSNTYSGVTTITAGALQLGSGGTMGGIAGDVADNAALAIDRSDAVTLAGVISGVGTLTQKGTGTTVLTGANDYSGATAITAGTLQIGNGGATGALGTGAVADAGSLVFDLAGGATVGNAIAGGGSLTQEGTGTTVLGGASTYSGGTFITGGVLQVASLSTNLGTGTLTLDGGELVSTGASTFSHRVVLGPSTDTLAAAATTATYSGVISGTGGLIVGDATNTGRINLTAANTYSGATTVANGTLNLTGSLAGATTVSAGAILTGTGSMSGTLTIAGGGTIDLAGANSTLSLRTGGLTLGSTGAYTSADYATLDFSAGANGIEQLNASGHGVTANNVFVDVTGTLADGSYTLATFNSTTLGNFSLSSTLADVTSLNVGRQLYTINDGSTAGTLVLTVTGVSTPEVAYWNGAVSTVWNDLSNSNQTNFSTNLAGTTDAGNIPGADTDVILDSSLQTGTATVTMTLGGDTTINSLNVNGNGTNTIGVGDTLTINALGDSNTSSGAGETVPNYTGNAVGQGILIGAAANAFTIDAAVDLGNSQTWTNSSTNAFTVNGDVSGTASTGTQVLTLSNTGAGGTTIGGAISDSTAGGAIAVTIDNTGAGITQLTNTANSFTGGTTLTAGTLQLTASSLATTGELGSTSGQLSVNGGTLDLNGTSQSVGNLTGTGGTILNNGNGASTLTIGTGDATGGAYAGVLADNTTGTGTLALVKTGAGVATLSGNNTYSGGTTVTGGALEVSADTNLGTGALTLGGGELLTSASGFSTTKGVTLDAGTDTLAAATATNAAYHGVIGGAGGLTVGDGVNTGTVTLSGTNTYLGGTTIKGILAVQADAALGNAAGGVTLEGGELETTASFVSSRGLAVGADGGALAAGSGTTLTWDGAIANQNGVAPFTLTFGDATHDGTIVLGGANTFTSAVLLVNGTLQMGIVDALASASSTTIDGGTLDLNGFSQTLHNFSGTGGVITNTSATAGTLTIDEDADPLFAGAITGNMSVTQSGAGALILTGHNTYANGTTIAAGSLLVGSATALGTGNVTNAAGTLATYGSEHVINVGTGAVVSNYIQDSGATLFLNLNGAPSSNPGVTDTNDVLKVSGTATLNGTLALNFTFAPAKGSVFEVVETGGGIVGTPGANFLVPTVAPRGLAITASESIDHDDFFVTIMSAQLSLTSIPGVVYTPNQAAVANYISSHVTSGPLFGALARIAASDPQALPAVQDQLSPEQFGNFVRSTVFNNAAFSAQSLDSYLEGRRSATGDFLGGNGQIDSSGLTVVDPSVDAALASVSSRLLAWSPAPLGHGLLSDTSDPVVAGIDAKEMAPAASPNQTHNFNAFVMGSVVLAQDFSQPDVAHADTTTGAVQVGADYRITPHLRAGALFGYGHTDGDLDPNGSKATVDSYAPGAYAAYANKGWYANVVGTYGFDSFTEDRHISIGGLSGIAHGAPDGDQIVGNLDGGYDFHRKNWTFGPTAGVQYTHLDVNSYRENGDTTLDSNLAVDKEETDSLRSRLGAHVSYLLHTGTVVLTPHLDASWQHEFLDQSRGITSQFTSVGAGSFSVATPNPSRDSALIDGGLNADLNGQVSLFLDYLVQAGQSNYFGQSVQAGAKIGF